MGIADWIIRKVTRRNPDFVIGADNPDGAYMKRWWVIPRNRVFNVYLHQVLRDDDARALHDHPWLNLSIILRGGYIEHTIEPGGIHRRTFRAPGSIKLRLPSSAHRLELPWGDLLDPDAKVECWSLFITGPNVRSWGFHCPDKGWVHWREFTAAGRSGEIGPGCGE